MRLRFGRRGRDRSPDPAGDPAAALEALQELLGVADPEVRDRLRRVMVAIFTELGPAHPLATEHRRRLAAALN